MIKLIFVNDNTETWLGNYGNNGELTFPPGISRHDLEVTPDEEFYFVFGPPETNFGYGVDNPWTVAEDGTTRVVYAHRPEEGNVVVFEDVYPV